MKIKTAYSTKPAISNAVGDIQKQLAGFDVTFLVFFASSKYKADETPSKIQLAFPKAQTIGCTTAGEIISGKMLENSLVAMAFSPESLEEIAVELATDINKSTESIDMAFNKFNVFFGKPMTELEYENYFGLILTDGLSGCEEKVMERVGDLTNIQFVGGSAGDDLKFEKTYIFANGKAYTNASVMAVVKPTDKFSIIKTQSFEKTEKKLIPTKMVEKERRVLEFNHKPAVTAYAEALGISESELSTHFADHPLGLIDFQNNPYVRSPQKIEGKDIVFYCNVLQGMELSVLNSTHIINDTRQAIEEAKQELGGISGLINFHCILRTLDLKNRNQTEEYGKLFKSVPTIGFSTYGESFIGHINQTSTMVALK